MATSRRILCRRPGDLNLCYHAPSTKGCALPPKILVLRFSSLGDVVLCSSFLRSLHDLFPDAQVSFAVRDDLQAVAQALPHVDTVVSLPREAGRTAIRDLGTKLAENDFTHVFDLHRSLRSRLLVHAMRDRVRPGFHKQSVARWFLIHLHRDWYDRFGGSLSMRQRMLLPLQRLGLQPQLQPTQLLLPEAARNWSRDTLQGTAGASPGTTWIGMAPGALWSSKQWPEERFVETAQRLLQAADHRLVLVGGEREKELCARIAAKLPERSVSLAGHTDILHTAAVLQRCALTITNDSGLLHVAEAVGSPVVALFGPTSPRFGYAPALPASHLLYAGTSCSPCSKNGSRPCHRPTHECMLAVASHTVVDAAESILTKAAS